MDKNEVKKLFQKLLEPINDIAFSDQDLSLKELFDKRLGQLDLSMYQAEQLLNIEHKSLVGILDRTSKRVDVVNVLKLGNFLNLKTEDLFKIYLSELPSQAIGELEKAKKSNFIASNFDLANLHKIKFIDKKNDFSDIEARINRYFNFNTIFEYNEAKIFPAFSRTKRSSNDPMRDFWLKGAYAHFKGINNSNEYDRDALLELIPKIRPYTINIEKGLLIVARALFNVGVTVIFQPYLPTVQARGATFLVNNKPCIVITDLNKNYPTLWFALMHELYHVLFDMETLETSAFHMTTGEPDLLLIDEDGANDFARDYLFSIERSKYIAPFINNEYMVKEYAVKHAQVHPSFVYNFYNYDQRAKGIQNAWSKYQQYFPDVNLALKGLNTNPWEKETIQESVELIKQTIFKMI